MSEHKNEDFIHCHACKQELQVFTVRELDGFCPCCDAEINLDEEPYTYKATAE